MRGARVVGILAMLALAFVAAPASADWSAGANFGLSIFVPTEGGDNLVTLDLPAGASSGFLVIAGMPGLRFGFTSPERQEEFHLDAGLATISGSGDMLSALQLTGNFQHAFQPRSQGNQTYVTVGLGTSLLTGSGDTVNSFLFGLGVGQRIWAANGNGSVRLELRYDRVGEAKDSGFTVRQALNEFQARFGFDLWPGARAD